MNRNSFRLLSIAALLLATAGAGGAHATVFGDSHDTNNNPVALGGTGGTAAAVAGAASSSTAVSGAAAGAAVVGSGNSSVANSVKNTNANNQGQLQGQQQQQSNRSSNDNRSSSTGGAASAQSGSNSGGNSLATGTTVTNTFQAQERNPVNSAYSAGLTSSNGTCMGSSSVGATGPGFSISGGSTWKDSDCSRRYTADALRASGMNAVAMGVLCQIADVKAAAPKQCEATAKLLGSVTEEDPIANKIAEINRKEGTAVSYNQADPFIAARMEKQGK